MSYVIKRNGQRQDVHFDKITSRIRSLCFGLNSDFIDPVQITQKVVRGLRPGITTSELDELAAETAAGSANVHPDFATLAARITISNMQKDTEKRFSDVMDKLARHTHPKTGAFAPLVDKDINAIIQANKERLDSAIVYARDYNFDFFGFKTLERSYLLKFHGKIAERPQHMYMRVAVGIHRDDIDAVIETYNLMSNGFFTHATPTLFNAGTCKPQMSSCFLLTMKSDSIEGIYDTLKQCASISKYAGGIGLSIHKIRATDSYIAGTNGSSNGIVPMLQVYNNTARYVDQGGGRRKGSFAVYLEPWHADVEKFLELKKNHGKEEHRARDLFYALWVPDLFMKRVKADADWTLFCPNEAPGLADVHSEEFEALFERYEAEGRGRKTMKARALFRKILQSQIETGTPYMMYKDACNRKSNQKNLGTIRSSNLCTEIIQYTSPDEIAVCNLASIALPKFVQGGKFDFEGMQRVVRVVTRNLNKVIDRNMYPLPEARNSNMRHRPVGIGVQGLADTFAMLRMPFESPQARALNRDIFEAIYFAACETSCDLAEADGPYASFEGSPASEGKLQFDLWGVEPSDRWDWAGLKARIREHGMRNSLLLSPMPTASTAQILGNNEGFEPFTSNIYSRRVLAGDFVVVNKHMMKDLIRAGLWTHEVRNQIVGDRGSIQRIACIPQHIKDLYKTVWEIRQSVLMRMAADRGAFICQSQSFNLHIAHPSEAQLTTAHFMSWELGLKTGMYYLRTNPKAQAIQFTVDQKKLEASRAEGGAGAGAGAGAMKVNVPKPPRVPERIPPSPMDTMSTMGIAPIRAIRMPGCDPDDPECDSCGS